MGLLRFAVRIWLDLAAVAVTAISIALDVAGVGSFPWQVPALVGLIVFVVVVYARVYQQRRELDQRTRYEQIADDLSGFRAETDKLLATFAAGSVNAATTDDALKWASRVAAYLNKNCGLSYREQFLIIDYARPRAEWTPDDGDSPLTAEARSAMTQVSARSNNLNDIVLVFQAAARGEVNP